MSLASEKSRLRREVRDRVLGLAPLARESQESTLRDKFPSLPGLEPAGTVLLYASAFAEELDTRPYLAWVVARGRRLLCPRVDRRTKTLRLYEVRDPAADLVPGVLGIPEPRLDLPEVPPTEVDWVLVPGLAFDPLGYRLGRGAGHYDKLMPRLRPDAPRWALCFDEQWVEAVPVEPHDARLDGVVSSSMTVVVRPPVA